jgi:isopentenyl-diphosphate delta-isomerase type 1
MNTDDQLLLLVDENDNFSGGYEKRKICHWEKGIRHRAFAVLLENKNGEVLLQKRKHKLWDNFWDTSAISHNLHREDHDETYEEAGNRALRNEMGIPHTRLKKIGGFSYFAQYGKNCENEYCAILTGKYIGPIVADDKAVYGYVWMKKEDFIKQCLEKNKEYTPWAILTGEFLANKV